VRRRSCVDDNVAVVRERPTDDEPRELCRDVLVDVATHGPRAIRGVVRLAQDLLLRCNSEADGDVAVFQALRDLVDLVRDDRTQDSRRQGCENDLHRHRHDGRRVEEGEKGQSRAGADAGTSATDNFIEAVEEFWEEMSPNRLQCTSEGRKWQSSRVEGSSVRG
jgi:hypothetical protein